jgi:hypothetical protein
VVFPNLNQRDARPAQPQRRTIMPRYFFNTRIGDELVLDPEGEELRDPDHAWQVARAMVRELLEEENDQSNLLTARLEVTDEAGEVVLEFPFSEAIEIPKDDSPPTTH